MDNYNQMMSNDYNSMVYQNAGHQIPVEQQPQEQQHELSGADGFLPEHAVKMATNDYHEERQTMEANLQPNEQQIEGYEQQNAHLQPQDVLLIQNHQAQLQQSSVIEQSEEYNSVSGTEPMEQGNGDVVDESNTAPDEMGDEPKPDVEPSNEEVPVVEGQENTEKAENDPETAAEPQEDGAEVKVKEEGTEGQESQEPVEGPSEPPKPKEPKIDPDQCRACMSKENLQSIFEFKGQQMIANLIKIICPQLNIRERDLLPHNICTACVDKVSMAFEFKKLAEQTDKDFRAHLKRSQNKRRAATDYILLDAKVALLPSSTEEDEDAMLQDDDEFKVSKSEESEESEDSVDSDFKPKKKYYKKKTPSKKKKPPAPKSTGKQKKGRPSKTKTKGYKSNVVYIEAVDNEEDSDGSPVPKKKKKAAGVATEPRTPGGLPCPQCDRVLANSHGLREHLKSHSTEKFTCKLCNKQFKLRLSLDAHMARHKEEKERAEAKAKVKIVKLPTTVVKKVVTPSKPTSSSSSSTSKSTVMIKRSTEPTTGKDLFKTCAPLTSTYWSDSYSD